MKEYQSLSHARWDCKYHVVFIPKKRKQRIFGVLRKKLGEIFHELAQHKESKIVEGHIMPDHVHMCISIPPKYAVSNVIACICVATPGKHIFQRDCQAFKPDFLAGHPFAHPVCASSCFAQKWHEFLGQSFSIFHCHRDMLPDTSASAASLRSYVMTSFNQEIGQMRFDAANGQHPGYLR